MERQIDYGNGASSDIPPVHLIPRVLIDNLARRFGAGVASKGDKAWNALSANQSLLTNLDFLKDRLGHAIRHSYLLLEQISQIHQAEDLLKVGAFLPDPAEDAAAICWNGGYAICALAAIHELVIAEQAMRSAAEAHRSKSAAAAEPAADTFN